MSARDDSAGDVLDTSAAGGLIIRGGIVRGLGFGATTLLALVGVALLTRHLGVADFGRFQTVMSLITVVGTLTDAGMAALGLREYSQRTDEDRRRLIGTLLTLRLALTAVGAAIATAIAAAVGYGPALILGTLLAGAGLALTVLQTTLTIPLAAGLRNGTLAALEVVRQAATLALYVLLIGLGAGVVAFLGVTIPVGILLGGIAGYLVRDQVPRPAVDLGAWGALLRSTVAFAMATAVGTMYLYTAQILTAAVTDARDTGLFSASFRVFVVVGTVPGLLITVAFPLLSRAARDDRERLAYAVQRLTDTTSLLGIGAALALVAGAPAILQVMAGPAFADADQALRIQGATLLASFVLAPIGFALLSLHAHRQILWANAAALVVTLVAVGALASAAGPAGAAAGTVAGEAVLALGYYAGLRSASREVAPGFGPGLRGLVAAVPALLIAELLHTSAWIEAALALAVYAVMLVVVRAIPDELRELARR